MKHVKVSLAEAFGTMGPDGKIVPVPGIDASILVDAIEWDGTEEGHEAWLRQLVPPVDWTKSYPVDVLRDMDVWAQLGSTDTLFLYGPSGAGKSWNILQWHARLGKPLLQYTMQHETELFDLIGSKGLENGNTDFQLGPLALAAEHGLPILLDEFGRARSEVNVGLNGVFDVCIGQLASFALPGTDRVITPKEGFTILGTDNTNLSGDQTGLYATAKLQDVSLAERWAMAIKVDFPPDEVDRVAVFHELAAVGDDFLAMLFTDEQMKVSVNKQVKEHELITREDFVTAVIEFRGKVRNLSLDGGNEAADALERAISSRVLPRWIRYILMFVGVQRRGKSVLHYALERALTNTCTPTTKEAIHTLLTASFGVASELV